ncbi:MAG: peptidoglycan-binding domain-containing protein [Acidimicrobiia bacterium]|nr:peptidoglycan-binding domain-containing protein [Acidimicrobiia bacterium]
MSDDYAPLPVSLCNSGTFVSEAQTGLVTWGSPIDADGYFGLATETAVREFQSESELDPSGVIVGGFGQRLPGRGIHGRHAEHLVGRIRWSCLLRVELLVRGRSAVGPVPQCGNLRATHFGRNLQIDQDRDIAATFDYDGEPWTSALGIGQYPERGHECVGGQVAD